LPARVFVPDILAVLPLREDRDRAGREVDVAVAQAEDLAAPKHGEDADGDDPRDVLGHPRLELFSLVPVRKRGSRSSARAKRMP
jgi:hypothetical protein